MGFAYKDRFGVVHVVDGKGVAEANADCAVVETGIEHAGGYPQVDGKDVVAYVGTGEIYVDGNRRDGAPTELGELPESLQALLLELGFPRPE